MFLANSFGLLTYIVESGPLELKLLLQLFSTTAQVLLCPHYLHVNKATAQHTPVKYISKRLNTPSLVQSHVQMHIKIKCKYTRLLLSTLFLEAEVKFISQWGEITKNYCLRMQIAAYINLINHASCQGFLQLETNTYRIQVPFELGMPEDLHFEQYTDLALHIST